MGASGLHEVLVELFRMRPEFAAELLAGSLQVELPAHAVTHLETGDLTDVVPTEFRADAVVVLGARADRPVLGVIVEVQLRRAAAKRWSWPVYVATLRARLRCPVLLLVVCVDPAVARWAGTAIDLGGSESRIVPLVLGPDQIPVLRSPTELTPTPDLAVLSALAHGRDPDHTEVLHALADALATADPPTSTLYTDLVAVALPEAARAYLEDLMSAGTYEYKTEFVRKWVLQGRAEGREEGRTEAAAHDVLTVLDARGLTVTDDARTRITQCTDLEQLTAWLRRAATIERIEDLSI